MFFSYEDIYTRWDCSKIIRSLWGASHRTDIAPSTKNWIGSGKGLMCSQVDSVWRDHIHTHTHTHARAHTHTYTPDCHYTGHFSGSRLRGNKSVGPRILCQHIKPNSALAYKLALQSILLFSPTHEVTSSQFDLGCVPLLLEQPAWTANTRRRVSWCMRKPGIL